jgi:HEAT repeat protein
MLKSRMNFALRKESVGLLIVLVLAAAFQSLGQTIPDKSEAELIAVLKSDAPHKDKADACRQLAIIGTKVAVPTLAALLADEKLSHMARYALEPIPDPAVDEALRDALGKLKGMPLVGVIGSIGVRRDVRAVRPLTKMLQESDPEVAQGAARALGSIANQRATRALQRALQNAPPANKLALCEGLFRCAERHAAEGRRNVAIEIYDQLRKLDGPHQVRGGALRGAILARGKDGAALLRENLHSDDYILFSAACQTALELPGSEVTEALTAELKSAGGGPADNQILIIQTLGKRGDAAALPTLFAVTKSGAKPVRIAAIKALPEIRGASGTAAGLQALRDSSSVLVELLPDSDREISQAAKDSFGSLPCQATYDHILEMLKSGEASRQLTAIELIGRRRVVASIPELLEAARDADPKVRPAAIKMVGELGGPNQLSALLDLLMGLKASDDLTAAEQALKAVCTKSDDPQSHTERLTSLLAKAGPAQKGVLLRVLGVTGGTNALRAVRAAIDDSDEDVRAAAIRVLCGWKTADAAPDLLALANPDVHRGPDSSQKTAALQAYINLVRDESLSTEKKLAMCNEAAALIQRDEEKKLLLGVLATVPAVEALSMTMTHLDNPATKDEASLAAVAISEKIVEQKPHEVADALQKVMRATDNRDVRRRAKVILDKAKKAAEG